MNISHKNRQNQLLKNGGKATKTAKQSAIKETPPAIQSKEPLAGQLQKLLADKGYQLGEKSNLKTFMDEFLAAGMIPLSLTRWEMTGLDEEIQNILF